jgi:hypothetical protein
MRIGPKWGDLGAVARGHFSFKLALRDLEDMLDERGNDSYEASHFWTTKFGSRDDR